MKRTIKQEIMIRIALIFAAVIISGILTISGMSLVRRYSQSTEQSIEIHSLVLNAEKAHYSWVENLCSAVALGTEFTGSKDYRTCVLGNWFYNSDLSTIENEKILSLIEEMKPIHQAIHESAQTILDINQTNPEEASRLYREETKANVVKLVGILDQVAQITEEQVNGNQSSLFSAVTRTEWISAATVLVTIIVSILLVMYVMAGIVKPLQNVTESSRNLSEGKLNFHIDINSQNEIGILADSLNTSVKNLNLYISDITEVLDDMANGNLGRESQIEYIGDFVQIQSAIRAISNELSQTMEQIHSSATQVDSGSNQVAVGAQSLAQGATEQASEVDNLQHMIEQIPVSPSAGHGSPPLTSGICVWFQYCCVPVHPQVLQYLCILYRMFLQRDGADCEETLWTGLRRLSHTAFSFPARSGIWTCRFLSE